VLDRDKISLCEHRLGASTAGSNFVGSELKRALHPDGCTPFTSVKAHYWRQRTGEWIAVNPIAAEITAHDARFLTASAMSDDRQPSSRRHAHNLLRWHRRQIQVAS
jgi:hypothetical protein